ncbi:MAG: hypothetical protein COT25_03150 [Candidatus Kerfeldbacteria bacterium CG08_land_8_20_14_0_20_42_7]|uniref:CDP-diacylglycerol--glycerol-3-phosphate 3-phosphatidyltransferase n=1 Tax=Candidatus Kerfeldbacteria bacterium CG08_land_8_20_14_0_20_42_7 TaxID=2014245 RepID=A0A2H0YSM1_9BACT|nr:MAG: hypothetical protein COT25_03150 [Candidatus Kerfeldbacteria bacterium CG08_land_8_20_14_0_20_42_7]
MHRIFSCGGTATCVYRECTQTFSSIEVFDSTFVWLKRIRSNKNAFANSSGWRPSVRFIESIGGHGERNAPLGFNWVWHVILLSSSRTNGYSRQVRKTNKTNRKKKRIITIPNIVTLNALFLCIPAGFALVREHYAFALWLLLSIFASDWLDGWIARRFNQVTHFGAALDPIRDFCVRFLLLLWFLLQINDTIIFTLGIITAVLEIVSSIINSSTAWKYRTTSLVTFWGKARALTQFICFGALLGSLIELFTLTLTAERILFSVIAFASLVALLSYYGQRQRFNALFS